MKLKMTIMCSLLNYQTKDLEDNLRQRKKQIKKADAEMIEIIMPATISLSCK
jgi:hypothetical protein